MRKLLIVLLFFISNVSFSADKPNIIFIYADDIGYGDFGCYGGEVQTVNIDDMAEKGVQFLNGYCTSSTCTPSRYSLSYTFAIFNSSTNLPTHQSNTAIASPRGPKEVEP